MDAQKIPLDDPDTMSIFQSSKVLGYENDKILGPTGGTAIPEFNTTFVRGMLEDTQPHQFDILVRLSGFSHGTDVWLGNAKDLIDLRAPPRSGEAIGCRDDIMLFLISKGHGPQALLQDHGGGAEGPGPARGGGGGDEGARGARLVHRLLQEDRLPVPQGPRRGLRDDGLPHRLVQGPPSSLSSPFLPRLGGLEGWWWGGGGGGGGGGCRGGFVEQDMLTTLEVCYEFYLRGFTFRRMDLYLSDALHFRVDEEHKALIPPFISVAGLGKRRPCLWRSRLRDGGSSL